jgi:acetate kinase
MGTRSGSIDPSIVTYLAEKENLSIKEIDTMLNKKSGAYGLSGISADFRDIEKAAAEGDKRSILALESNAYLTAQKIASYIATLRRCRCCCICWRCSEKMVQKQERESVIT